MTLCWDVAMTTLLKIKGGRASCGRCHRSLPSHQHTCRYCGGEAEPITNDYSKCRIAGFHVPNQDGDLTLHARLEDQHGNVLIESSLSYIVALLNTEIKP